LSVSSFGFVLLNRGLNRWLTTMDSVCLAIRRRLASQSAVGIGNAARSPTKPHLGIADCRHDSRSAFWGGGRRVRRVPRSNSC
jgi:hypothetical protein